MSVSVCENVARDDGEREREGSEARDRSSRERVPGIRRSHPSFPTLTFPPHQLLLFDAS